MRGFLACVFAGAIFSIIVRAADTGVPPRAASTDYPVHERADAAVIAAAIIPANQVSKIFSPDIAKQYIIVEVAIYPANSVPFDVQSSDFALRVGQRVGRADRPMDVSPWPEKRNPAGRPPVSVTTVAGVTYDHSDDPLYGRRQGGGTYTGVAVEAPGRVDPPAQP